MKLFLFSVTGTLLGMDMFVKFSRRKYIVSLALSALSLLHISDEVGGLAPPCALPL